MQAFNLAEAQNRYDTIRMRMQCLEDEIEIAQTLQPGDSKFEEIKTEIQNEEDVEDAEASTFALLEWKQEELEKQHNTLLEELEDLETEVYNAGFSFDEEKERLETNLMISQDIHESKNTDWKRKADEEIDSQRLLCPFCVNPERENTVCFDSKYKCNACDNTWYTEKRQSVALSRKDSSNNNEENNEENNEAYEEEVHILSDNDNDTKENDVIADTLISFTDQNDRQLNPKPISIIKTGAIRHEFGRVDPHMAIKLMSHQVEAVDFVLNCFLKQFGCVLALSMGMGKTLTTLTILDTIAQKLTGAYTLVIAPSVIAPNWEHEYDNWAPKHLIFHAVIMKMESSAKRSLKNAQKTGGLIVTTVDTFKNHQEVFGNPMVMIIDEGHKIKNHRSQLFTAVDTIETPYTLALTGTPLQNNLQECFTLINWVAPGLLGSSRQFQHCYASDIESYDSDKSKGRAHMLKMKLDEVVFRRDNLAALLPTKYEYRVALNCSQSSSKSSSTLVQYSESLSQTMPDKLFAIGTILKQVFYHRQKAVVFSGRKQLLSDASLSLYTGPVMTGDTLTQERQDMIHTFQTDPTCNVIYISTKTGAQGINLTAGTVVIIADASFNPTWEMQAVCRCWRIGQKNEVLVFRLIAHNTIEDTISKLFDHLL